MLWPGRLSALRNVPVFDAISQTLWRSCSMWKRKRWLNILTIFIAALLAAHLVTGIVFAQDDTVAEETTTEEAVAEVVTVEAVVVDVATVISNLDTVWMLIAGFLVFFMQAGFALVEAGFVRARNVTNILMKNTFDLAIGALAFWAVGFAFMFGDGNGFIGTDWFFLGGLPEVYPGLTVPSLAFFFFQFAFAATAATIASGAMAERTDFRGYLIYSGMITALVYPIVGHWIWGGGWLATLDTPFFDFAGSTVVHSTGGWVGLMGAVFLGARKNRFGKDAVPMPGHNMTYAALGMFILWLGWFGFNPGSQLNADGSSIALITVTTNIAAAAGAMVAMLLGWFHGGKPQLPWGINGALAGLVSVTAPTAIVTPSEAVIIGAIGAVIMYFGVLALEKFRIDDPIGAVPVHGFCGVWGTLSVGIFGAEIGLLHGGGAAQLATQFVGVIAVGAFVISASAILFAAIKALGILRISERGEGIGLDIYEHGMVNYPEFTSSPSEPTLSPGAGD
ncbi:MAG: ammonium transporter [Phototrophicales bacterium]|nr:MAG: ammonium transporter [Phototrophicales bacterium]